MEEFTYQDTGQSHIVSYGKIGDRTVAFLDGQQEYQRRSPSTEFILDEMPE